MNLKNVSGIDPDLVFKLWFLLEMNTLNKKYQIKDYHSGFYAIGSDGGIEMLSVELISGVIYRIPFISSDNSEKIEVSNSISELTKLNY